MNGVKKRYLVKCLATALLACLASASILGCSAKKKDSKLRLTFVCPIVGNVYWNKAVDGMNAAAKEIGGIDIAVVGPTTINMDQMAKDFDGTIAAKVDGIIVMSAVDSIFTPLIDKAVSKGIPVATIDSDAPNSKRSLYVGTANQDAGMVAGKAMAKLMNGKANIAVITNDLTATNLNARIDGFKAGITDYPDMKIVTTLIAKDVLDATQKVPQMIRANPAVNAIFTADGQTPKGACKSLVEMNLVGKVKIISFDEDDELLQDIRDGVLAGTTAQQPYVMGYQTVKQLKELIVDHKAPAQAVQNTPVKIITKENIDQKD